MPIIVFEGYKNTKLYQVWCVQQRKFMLILNLKHWTLKWKCPGWWCNRDIRAQEKGLRYVVVSVLRERERIRYVFEYTRGVSLGKLAHEIMAAQKTHDRSPISWWPWGASSLTQPKSENLRSRETKGVTFNLRLKTWVLEEGSAGAVLEHKDQRSGVLMSTVGDEHETALRRSHKFTFCT
jgi:hypothetical protein